MRFLSAGWAVALAGFFAWPQTMVAPEFFHPPKLKAAGPEVRVEVMFEPFGLKVDGDAHIERLDDHRVRFKSPSGNVSIGLKEGEAVYGLTERIVTDRRRSETFVKAVGDLDRRGERVKMWVFPSEAVYAPFYISSAGYGMYVEGTWPGWYDIGKSDKDRLKLEWETGPEGFSCVFIQGSYTEVLDRYTRMTGRPILPPRWSFMPWKWRDEHAAQKFDTLDGVTINAEVAEDIKMYEQLGFPKGVYLIDRPWAEGTYGYGNYNWDENRFPNGDRMIELMHDRGWRVILWASPWALGDETFELGHDAKEKGYVMGDRCIDYTNPEALAWHHEKLVALMKKTGIDGWKLDRADEYNPSGREDLYHDGRTGIEVHNDYPRMYVKLFYDVSRAVRGDDFIIKSRPAYTGTTSWSIVYGGDIPGALLFGAVSTDKGLRSAIIALQRTACMGYPVWGSDTGGYEGFTEREVFARWLAFSAFCPLMEIGGVGEHEPWAMPGEPRYDEEMIRIYRRYTTLHARLVDYTYQLAKRAHRTGNPIVHPLVFDWPDDPEVRDMWDEYMYGPALLVAPVWETGKREREVYLPKGEWICLWDRSRKYTGPVSITEPAPINTIPVFIKADRLDLLPDDLIGGL
jgi:alpha-glucosidase (family GH31 glycosyl hydrolase)